MNNAGLKIFAITAAACAALLAVLAIGRLTLPAGGGAALLPQEAVSVGGQRLMLEVAATGDEQARGLGGRDSLAPDAGMIFVFSKPGRPAFWMKDMRFALDFIYVRGGKIVALKENVRPEPMPTPFFVAEDIDAVIEVNAGWVAAHGVRVGDTVMPI